MEPGPLVSSDSHVIEPPDLWQDRIAPALRDRAPRMVHEGEADFWHVDGERLMSFSGGAQPGQRFDDSSRLRTTARFEQVLPAAYDPVAHLDATSDDGVYASVLYPSLGLLLYGLDDAVLLQALCCAYNDWLSAFCAVDTNRLKGVAMLLLDDVGWAVEETERVAGLGLAGVMVPVSPDPAHPYSNPRYDPFWAAADASRLPVSLHVATNRGGLGEPDTTEHLTPGARLASITPSTAVNVDYWVRRSLADMIFSGLFERFPALRVGAVEHELGWVPYFLEQMDYTYTQRARRPGWRALADGALPSDHFRRNVFVSFQEDALGIRERATIGLTTLTWGSDFPHHETTYPRSRRILSELLADVPPDDAAAIVAGNCARLYDIDLPVVADAGRP